MKTCPDSIPHDLVRWIACSVVWTALTLVLPGIVQAQSSSADSAAGLPSERLPFGANDPPLRAIGFGAGMTVYTGSLAGVERAFTKLEDVYRAQGYPLSRTEIRLDPIRSYRITVRPAKNYEVVGQVGRSKGTDMVESELSTTGVLLVRRFAATAHGGYSLTAGLGGGAYGFSFTRFYNAQVSPTSSDGSFYVLRQITLEGSGAYGTAAAGFTLRAGRYVALDAVGQYLFAKEVTAHVQPAGRISMSLSGLLFGATLTLFY